MSTQSINVPVAEIFKSRNIILNLMKNQGYKINDYENFSINEINIMKQNNQLDMLLEKENNNGSPNSKIYIKYYLTKGTIRPSNITEMIDDLFTLEEILTPNDTLFIIAKDEINETLTNYLKHIWDTENIFIVIESIKRLQFNILDHVLVPKHIVLNDEEIDVMMKRYNVNDKSQLPEISRFDPVSKAILLRPNMVCKIIRPSKTAIKSEYYRVCI